MAVGLCARATPAGLASADVEERVGCAVTLTWDPAARAFSGGTEGTACTSTWGNVTGKGAADESALSVHRPCVIRGVFSRGPVVQRDQLHGVLRFEWTVSTRSRRQSLWHRRSFVSNVHHL